MTKIRDIALIVTSSDKGGVGKTYAASLLGDIMRHDTGMKTVLIDGDEKVRKFIERFGNRDDEGGLLPPEANDPFTGCKLVDLRNMENSAAEIMGAFESGATRILIDGAGGSETNYGRLLRPTAKPEEFTEFLAEEGISAVFIANIMPDDDATIMSLANLWAKYKGDEGIHFVVVLNRWSGDIDGTDSHFADWFASRTRAAMIEAGNISELNITTVYEDVMAKVREMPVPFSVMTDKDAAQALGIDMRTRRAIRNARTEIVDQINADPTMKEIFGL
jgi:hypothetical protein